MHFPALVASIGLIGTSSAFNVFVNEPDTGLTTFLGADTPAEASGTLISLDNIVTIPDFDFAARAYMTSRNYSYYRTGAAGEFSYRENLDSFADIKLRPRVLRDITNVQNTMNTTIMGHEFSAPFFISPAARGYRGNVNGELGLVQGAAPENGNILYIPSLYADLSIAEIAAAKAPGQITWQQLYVKDSMTAVANDIKDAEAAGSTAIVWSVDNAWDPARARSSRWVPGDPSYAYLPETWQLYATIQNLTTLPVIPKGIQTVEDAQLAVAAGAKAIYVSNHGGRQLDTSQSPIDVVLEIYLNAPEVFDQVEVLCDGGVRYGTDVLKLLALGCKAVGMGRPFMYANIYGAPGVEQLIQMMKDEIIADFGNVGAANVQNVTAEYLNLNRVLPRIYTAS